MPENFVKVCELDQLPLGKMLCVQPKNYRILLANVDGKLYAVDDMCTHEDASLTTGSLHGDCVKCPLHGSRFDLKTGEPLEEPADEKLQTYNVRIEGASVFVQLDHNVPGEKP